MIERLFYMFVFFDINFILRRSNPFAAYNSSARQTPDMSCAYVLVDAWLSIKYFKFYSVRMSCSATALWYQNLTKYTGWCHSHVPVCLFIWILFACYQMSLPATTPGVWQPGTGSTGVYGPYTAKGLHVNSDTHFKQLIVWERNLLEWWNGTLLSLFLYLAVLPQTTKSQLSTCICSIDTTFTTHYSHRLCCLF
jgi:hypothetical protein